jgi:hypothetical protein
VIAALDGLAGLPPDEHVAVFEDIHGKLRQVLSELDSGPADSGPADSGPADLGSADAGAAGR